MKTRIVIGLVMTLVLGALMAAPVSAEPGKGKGQGAQVSRGTQMDTPNLCVDAITAIADLEAVDVVNQYRWRWVYKSNGRPSKLFCRIKGAEMVDPPAKPWGNVVRMRGTEDLAGICPQPADMDPPVGDLFRARLKLNAKGNGFLKCVYQAPAD